MSAPRGDEAQPPLLGGWRGEGFQHTHSNPWGPHDWEHARNGSPPALRLQGDYTVHRIRFQA